MNKFGVLLLGCLGFLVLDLALGSVAIPFDEVITILTGGTPTKATWSTIILQFRLPRAIVAILVGAALSVSGLLMQTFFRNPIAGPYVLGISSGASLGVACFILGTGLWGTLPFLASKWTLVIFAALGAALVLLLVLAVSWRVRDVATLLIVGLMFGSATSSIVTVLQYFSGEVALKRFVIWGMGDLGGITWEELSVLLPIILMSLMWVLILAKPLNALLLGEDYAKTLGVPIQQVRWQIILSTAVLAGSITAFCGPIGFIGIAVPHLTRMLFRTQEHRILIPATILVGIVIMLFCDMIAQLPGSDKNLPINAVTSLIGAPVVIWIVMRQ